MLRTLKIKDVPAGFQWMDEDTIEIGGRSWYFHATTPGKRANQAVFLAEEETLSEGDIMGQGKCTYDCFLVTTEWEMDTRTGRIPVTYETFRNAAIAMFDSYLCAVVMEAV